MGGRMISAPTKKESGHKSGKRAVRDAGPYKEGTDEIGKRHNTRRGQAPAVHGCLFFSLSAEAARGRPARRAGRHLNFWLSATASWSQRLL